MFAGLSVVFLLISNLSPVSLLQRLAAAVIARGVKRASADSAESAQQCDRQDDENDGPT